MSEPVIQHLEQQLSIQSLKLNALLEITSAINSNAGVDSLLAIYAFILKEQLLHRKFVLFIKQEDWNCPVKVGYKGKITLDEHLPDLLRFKETTFLSDSNSTLLREFQTVIPVYHSDQPLAYLLIGEARNTTKNHPVDKDLDFTQTLTNIICVAIENKGLERSLLAKERINKDLEVASELQKLLFPSNLPSNRKMDVSAKYVSREVVSGDYYDFIPLGDEEYIICIADVSGKGVSAALLMANFQATIRALFRYQRFDLSFLIEELNKKVVLSAQGEKFITFFIAHYNAFTRTLKYINAGHNQPLLTIGKKHQLLHDGCIGLGMLDELPNIKVGKLFLPPKSTLVLYTDGVVELENEEGEAYGLERMIKNIQAFSSLKMEDMNNILFSKLDEWKGRLPYGDDTAILSCKFF